MADSLTVKKYPFCYSTAAAYLLGFNKTGSTYPCMSIAGEDIVRFDNQCNFRV